MTDRKASLALLVGRINERLTALGISPREASLRTGRGPDVLRNIQRAHDEGKAYSPRTDTLGLIADALETSTAWLTGTADRATVVMPREAQADFFGPRDLPIYSAVEGGLGEMVIDNEPIELVARPWYLREVKEGYGVVYTGESMFPKYEPGDILVVNPKLPLLRNKPAIFIDDRHGGFRATVKIFHRRTSKGWQVEQYNPRKEFDLDHQTWSKAFRVVGTYEGI